MTLALSRTWQAAPYGENKDFLSDLLARTIEFAQSHPLAVVRNSCFVHKQNSSEWPNDTPQSYTEMNVTYPYID